MRIRTSFSFNEIKSDFCLKPNRTCLNLQYLSLAYCNRLTDEGFRYLASKRVCCNLIYLDLSGCTQVSGNPPLRSAFAGSRGGGSPPLSHVSRLVLPEDRLRSEQTSEV